MAPIQKIAPSNVEDILALTSTQAGLLFHFLKDPEHIQYHLTLQVQLAGEVHPEHFREAWQTVVNSHEMLRTLFRWEGVKTPVQIVLRHSPIDLVIQDLSSLDQDQIQSEFIRMVQQEKERKFTLNQVPFRIVLMKLGEAESHMLIRHHHILYDGWSTAILVKEFLADYRSRLEGKMVQFPPKTRFRELIKWVQKQDQVAQANYWKKYLGNFDSKTILPFQQQNNAVQLDQNDTVSSGTASYALTLPGEVQKQLKSFTIEHGTTTAALLYTAWGIFLQCNYDQSDVVFGITHAGRPVEIPKVEEMVGLFVNTLPLRISFTDSDKLIDVVRQAQHTLATQSKFAHTPLANIQQYCGMGPQEALFDSIVVIENYPVSWDQKQEKAGVSVVDIKAFETTNYPLALVIEVKENISFRFLYHRNHFDEKAIQRIATYFTTALQQILAHPNQNRNATSLLSASEQAQLLKWLPARFPANSSIHGLFEAQVHKHAERIAVADPERELTYAQLNHRANQLAHHLVVEGIHRGEHIGILLDRSVDMVATILGVLKAGGAYLPIDPEYPDSRIQFMIEDSGIQRVVTTAEHVSRINGSLNTCLLDQVFVPGSSSKNLDLPNSPEDLAYILYTSGTSGKPKGVMTQHRNVISLLFHENFPFEFGPEDVWSMFHSYCFDFSVWEMLGALLYGGKLIIADRMVARDPAEFRKLLKREHITVLNQTPRAFYNLLDHELQQSLPDLNLRYIIFGGDALTPSRLLPWQNRYPHTRLVNMFGITETTVHVTYKEITTKEINAPHSNIGKPLPSLQTYILNQDQRLLPVGVAGELFVAGAGVAKGYLNRPELTRKKFIKNPYRKGENMYRSGDLVRQLANGDMEYLGRIDRQVQISGVRVEPGEVEAELILHPDIKKALVTAQKDSLDRDFLCAYVIGVAKNTVLNTSDLRNFLTGKLPGFLVPSSFVQIPNLPLTLNGKVDHQKLPDPNQERMAVGTPFQAPGDELENIIAEVWKAALNLDQVGVHHKFFDLGGNSLNLIGIKSQLEKTLDRKVTVADMFNHPTVSSLANFLRGQQEDNLALAESQTQAIDRGKKDRMKRLAKRRAKGK